MNFIRTVIRILALTFVDYFLIDHWDIIGGSNLLNNYLDSIFLMRFLISEFLDYLMYFLNVHFHFGRLIYHYFKIIIVILMINIADFIIDYIYLDNFFKNFISKKFSYWFLKIIITIFNLKIMVIIHSISMDYSINVLLSYLYFHLYY